MAPTRSLVKQVLGSHTHLLCDCEKIDHEVELIFCLFNLSMCGWFLLEEIAKTFFFVKKENGARHVHVNGTVRGAAFLG